MFKKNIKFGAFVLMVLSIATLALNVPKTSAQNMPEQGNNDNNSYGNRANENYSGSMGFRSVHGINNQRDFDSFNRMTGYRFRNSNDFNRFRYYDFDRINRMMGYRFHNFDDFCVFYVLNNCHSFDDCNKIMGYPFRDFHDFNRRCGYRFSDEADFDQFIRITVIINASY